MCFHMCVCVCLWREREREMLSLYKHVRTHTNFLEMYDNGVCFREFSSTQ